MRTQTGGSSRFGGRSGPRKSGPGGGRPGGGRGGYSSQGQGGPGGGSRFQGGAGGGPRGRRPFLRRKICRFCADRQLWIDFKDRDMLKRFLTEKGKIIARRTTGNCAKHQRLLVRSIKRARHAAILAFQEA